MERYEPYSTSTRKTLGTFLSIGLGLAVLFTLFAYVADRFLFQPGPYITALDQYQFSQLFPRLLAEVIVGKQPPSDPSIDPPGSLSDSPSQIKYLNADDYASILSAIMPPDWVHAQTQSLLVQLFDFMNLKTRQLQLRLSMDTVKANLSGDQGSAIVLQVIHSWPPCSAEWLAQVVSNGIQGDLQGFPTCQPPDQYVNLIEPVVQSSITSLSSSIPDQIDLVQVTNSIRMGNFRFDQLPAASTSGGLVLPAGVQFLRWMMRLSPLIVIWLLIMLTVLAVRSWADLLVYWGVPLLGAGAIGVLLSLFAGMPLVSSTTARMGDQASLVVSRNMAEILSLAIQSVFQQYFLWVGISAGVVTLLGAGMVIAYVLRKRNV